jgi:hypothetical protein
MISIMTGTYVKNGRFLNGEKCSRTLIKDLFNAAFETSCIYNIFKGITSWDFERLFHSYHVLVSDVPYCICLFPV